MPSFQNPKMLVLLYLSFASKREKPTLKVFHIHYLQERINFEIILGGKVCDFVCLYSTRSQ